VTCSSLFSHFPCCQKSTPRAKLINFSIFSCGKGSSQATNVGLISDTCVPVFKMLYPSSYTTSTHVAIFICTLKVCMNMGYGYFLLNKKFYHYMLLKSHGLANHLLALKYSKVTAAGNVISCWCEMTDGTSHHIQHAAVLPGICLQFHNA
jgi:hypothetical protein